MMSKESIEEKIKDLEYVLTKVDGKSTFHNIGNRLFGLVEISLGSAFAYFNREYNFPVDAISYVIGAGFILDGLSTLATGKLHYALFRVTKSHPKYELEELKSQIKEE